LSLVNFHKIFAATGKDGWCQDNRNRSNQESKFDFLATRQQLGKIDGQQKIKIVRTNWQSNLRASCQSIFSLCWHHPSNWPEKQISIPAWTYFHCPGATLVVVSINSYPKQNLIMHAYPTEAFVAVKAFL